MKNFYWYFVCTLVILFWGASVNYVLDQVNNTRRYVSVEVAKTIEIQESIKFVTVSQDIIKIQTYQIVRLENTLQQAAQTFRALQDEKTRLTQVLEETSVTSADLIQENADLQKKLDALSIQYTNKLEEVKRLQQQLTDVTNKLDTLTKQVADILIKERKESKP